LIAHFERVIENLLQMSKPIPWYIMKLNYNSNVSEGLINDALSQVVNENSGRMTLINHDAYPKGIALTTAQRTPATSGFTYDNHASYIAQLAVGELITNNMLNVVI
jgi:hypothetical protein